MRVAIGADHAGFPLKDVVATLLRALGHEVIDLGTYDNASPVDYPDYAESVAEAVVSGKAERGIVLCGSGVGAAVAANKVPGARASVCHDTYTAHQGVEHDDMNILCLGARVIGAELAKEVVTSFLTATFDGEARHQRRVEKVRAIEQKHFKP